MQALVPSGPSAVAARFGNYRRLTVRQKRRWLEVLLSFEMKNAYEVYDDTDHAVLRVQEVGSGFAELVKRLFLGPIRPCQVEVTDLFSGEQVLRLVRPFRFIFMRLEVYAGSGERIGTIQKEWSWFKSIYTIEDGRGRPIAQINGPFFRPWTFELHQDGRMVGAIRKRWSGLGRELFTDADNFGVELDGIQDPGLKALAFAATVLIDLVHFERKK